MQRLRPISRLTGLFILVGLLAGAEPRREAAWALRPVASPAVPAKPCATPIDAFLLDRLHATGLTFAAPADRAALARRATFDLHGLPPTPEAVAEFVRDEAPDAHARLIDRLLANPRYGERWARHWLDLARFAESQGFERDKIRDHAWPYRDYVIRSFNGDKPYDQFVREQIAGDALPGATRDGALGTAFLVAGPYDEAGTSSVSQLLRLRIREEELEDMVGAVAQTFLGMTVNCARCHDHKFDPIPQRDYYRMKAVFDGVRHGDRVLETPEEKRARDWALAHIDAEIARLDKECVVIEADGRKRLMSKAPRAAANAPSPMSRWSFDGDARDAAGELHGTLRGPAKIERGRLILNGQSALVETSALRRPLVEKTLEAWVALPNLDQRAGGVMSVQLKNNGAFDAIVFAERVPRRWMAGSEGFVRTRDLKGPDEAKVNELVHLAIAYGRDHRIAVYRNGKPYDTPYRPGESPLRTFSEGTSQIVFGQRHTSAGNGFLTGEIEEARLYDRALSPSEIEASFQAGFDTVTLSQTLTALTHEERQRRETLLSEIARLRRERERVVPAFMAYVGISKQPEPTHVLLRGDVEKKDELVSAGGLSSVATPSADLGVKPDAPEAERRWRFANWVTDARNPLTARVMVNRLWQHHFGRGLVETPNDFGANGSKPTHPELLDWLAREFIDSGWSVKHMHRLIMLSSAYRQSSRFDEKAAGIDAEATLLWRFPPRRLEAEAVRDAMLTVSGRLNSTMGGPGFQPFKVTVFNSTFYDLIDEDRPEFNRRTIYRIGVNSAKDPLLESFDCPEPSVKTPRRGATTTPVQALGLMNNPFVQRQARAMAKNAGGVERAYLLAFNRAPTAIESRRAGEHVREYGLANLCWALLNSSEFLYVR